MLTVMSGDTDDKLSVVNETTRTTQMAQKEWGGAHLNAVDGAKVSEKAATVKEKPQGDAKSVIVIVSVCLVLLGLLCGTIVMVRRFRRARLHGGHHGDSQSDVRFLTNEEILNFSLATPDSTQ